MMTTVRQFLDGKGSNVWKITSDANVFDALRLMAEKNVGALLVYDKNKIVGIFSERDYARKVILKGKSSRDISVGEIMTNKVVYLRPEQTIEEAMALMTDKHIRHLPVCEGDDLLGIISIGDVVKAMISDREFIIEQLENYITQGG
jgi:CBS domain-containing protein